MQAQTKLILQQRGGGGWGGVAGVGWLGWGGWGGVAGVGWLGWSGWGGVAGVEATQQAIADSGQCSEGRSNDLPLPLRLLHIKFPKQQTCHIVFTSRCYRTPPQVSLC